MRKINYLVPTLMAISSSFLSSGFAMEGTPEYDLATQPPPKKRAQYRLASSEPTFNPFVDNAVIKNEGDFDESSLFTDEEDDKDICNLYMSISDGDADGENEEDNYSSHEVRKRINTSSEEQPVTYTFVPTDDLTPEETGFFDGKSDF